MPITLHARTVVPPLVEVATRGLEALGHPELVFVVREDLVPPQAVFWLAGALTEDVESGQRRWQPGERFRVGWSELTFVPEDDVLYVHEETPTGFERGVWRLLLALGRMNDGLEGLPAGARYPHQRQLASVSGSMDGPLSLHRHEPQGDDSGWCISGPGLGTVTRVALRELTAQNESLYQALALPPGARLRLMRGEMVDLTLEASG